MIEDTDDLYYEDDELFDMFDSEHTKEVILNLYENEILKKFGIKNLGYNRYKDCTFDLLEDIIYLSNDLGYGSYAPFIRSKNMAELKKCKYDMLAEYYKDVSNERYNFPQITEDVIKILKENFPDIIIIDSERKKKVEQHYQHCNLAWNETKDAKIGMYHLIVAFIDEGIRFTYAINIFEDVAYIAEDFCETNLANIGLKRKIDSILIDYRKKIQEKF